MIVAIALISLAIVSMYHRRHRIMKYEQNGRVRYVPQESTFYWVFWRDMEYAISPYSERTYSFDTLEAAKQFLESLRRNKVKKTVVG